MLLLILSLQVGVLASSANPVVDDPKANLALLFVNNAKTTYDDEVSKKLIDNFDKLLNGKYNLIPGDRYIERLSKSGITDISSAERADIIDAFKGDDVDYVLFVEIQPFLRKERYTFFTQGIDITAVAPIKIIDLSTQKYLYNGKITEFASDSTSFGMVGNKSVSMKALDKVIEKMNPVIQTRLPLDKPIKK